MLELRIIAGGTPMPIFDLPAALGRRGAAREIGDTIDSLIAFMDDLDGDPDLEGDDTEDSFALSGLALSASHGAGCPIADPGSGYYEDDEDDDPVEANGDEHDGGGAEDEEMAYFRGLKWAGPGCPVSDCGEALDHD